VKTFRFEPYTYGPFSFNLARDIERLVFWDEIKDEDNIITLDCEVQIDKRKSDIASIKKGFKSFSKITQKNWNFDNLEKIGTVLYCMEVLHNQNMKITLNNVKEEFRGWKGNKYSDEQIREAFQRVYEDLPVSLQ
jgi:uncharacterized protein YwgA